MSSTVMATPATGLPGATKARVVESTTVTASAAANPTDPSAVRDRLPSWVVAVVSEGLLGSVSLSEVPPGLATEFAVPVLVVSGTLLALRYAPDTADSARNTP